MIIQEVSNNRNIDGMKCLYKLTEQTLTCSLCREAFLLVSVAVSRGVSQPGCDLCEKFKDTWYSLKCFAHTRTED